MPSSSPPDTKASFRRLSSDAANRKYRRRSPANGSSSSDGSPKRDHSASPIFSRDDPAKVSEHQQRKDDERELDRDSGRSHHVRGGDSFRHSDCQSSRSSHNYSRHDYTRHDKYRNDEDRNYHRLSSRSGRESRDHSRSKDYLCSADKSSRDKYDVTRHRSKDKEKELSYLEGQKNKEKDSSSDRDGSGRKHTCTDSDEMDRDWHKLDRDDRDEKRDYRRSSADHRNDRRVTYEKPIGHRNDSSSGKTCGGYQFKEAHRSDPKERDGQKLDNEGKKKHDDGETNRNKDRYYRADKPDFASVKQETPTKKQKFSNWDKGADNVKDASGKMSSSSMHQDIGGTEALAQAHANDSVANDLDAAKVAAMRAAELVNKNLVGVGYLSTDQKKKLLWGNKKSTTPEESGHRWDSALFGDSDRQEKFNKLMSLRLPWYIWPIVGCEGRCEGRAQTQQSRWRRSPPSREAEGTTPARSGEAVHCWTSKERWPHSWIRSLSVKSESVPTLSTLFCDILLCSCSRSQFLVLFCLISIWLVRKLSLCRTFQIFGERKMSLLHCCLSFFK